MKNIQTSLIRIGLRIREIRKQQSLTLEQVAQRAEISKGLLSKIENFRAVPSLPVLMRIAFGLNVDAAELLKAIPIQETQNYIFIPADKRQILERDNAVGFLYQALTCQTLDTFTFDSFVLTLAADAQRDLVTTEGDEFIFILQGSIDFQLGDEHLTLHQGDALFFDGRIPHVSKSLTGQPAQLLAIYLLQHHK